MPSCNTHVFFAPFRFHGIRIDNMFHPHGSPAHQAANVPIQRGIYAVWLTGRAYHVDACPGQSNAKRKGLIYNFVHIRPFPKEPEKEEKRNILFFSSPTMGELVSIFCTTVRNHEIILAPWTVSTRDPISSMERSLQMPDQSPFPLTIRYNISYAHRSITDYLNFGIFIKI